MTYHLSSEQYQRGIDRLAVARLVDPVSPSTSRIFGMAEMLAHLASSNPAKVMRDSDARLADLDSPLTPLIPAAQTLICSACREASCAAGDLMCDDARTASFVEIPAAAAGSRD